MTQQKAREAVAVFNELKKLDEAVAELESEGFPRHSISVLGNKEKVNKRFGADAVRPEWLEDNPNAPRGISVRPEEKTIGASLIVAIPAYVGGCIGLLTVNPASNDVLLGAVTLGSLLGAAIGAAILSLIGIKLKDRINKQIRKGGLLLWVGTPEPEKEELALKVLRKNGGYHVHIHNIE